MIKLDIMTACIIAALSVVAGFVYDSVAMAMFFAACLTPCFWKIER